MEGTKIKESGKRRGEKNYRKCFFSGLEKPGKECVDIGMEDFCKGNKFRYLDVHTVGFQLGIGAFGHRNSHQVQFCNNLILSEFIRITDGLYIFTDIHIWSDFLHDKVLSFLECFAIKKLYIDFTGFTFYNVS